MATFSGEFMDGRSAALHSVRVSFDGMFLLIHQVGDGREEARWALNEITAEALEESDTLHLQTHSDPDALLTIRGKEAIEALAEIGITTRGLPRRTAHRLGFGLAFVAAIAGIASLVWISVTPLSKAIAHRVPMETERSLLGSIEQRLAPSYCDSDAASAALDALTARLVGAGEPLPPIHILNLELPNAFALPGGTVILTRGLMQLAESPDEMAGVLAHEIEHVRQRHVMAGVVRGAMLSALWAVSVGDFSGMMVIDPTTAFQIATLQFSREDEAEADRGAVSMLRRARIDTAGLSRFFERLEEEGGEAPEWLSSHPATGDRAEAAKSQEPISDLLPALTPEAWAAVGQACDDAPAPEAELTDLFF